jgi:dihydromethanopterin reductase (acceptor)
MVRLHTPRRAWVLTGSGHFFLLACGTVPELETMATHGPVNIYSRRIDLENTERLKSFELTRVVQSLADREGAVLERLAEFESRA